jgi:uncharacterized protein (TIGR01777 family)
VGTQRFEHSSELPVSAEKAFRWHERPGALPRLTPPWQKVEVLEAPTSLEDGSRAVLRLHAGLFRKRWVAEHRDYQPGVQFKDVQVEGPFARWEHTHRVEPVDDGRSRLTDSIDFALPFGVLGRWLGGGRVARALRQVFTYRHVTTAQDLSMHAAASHTTPMRVLVSGASGLVGSALCAFLGGGGHEVVRLVRGTPEGDDERRWNPGAGEIDAAQLEGFDAVVHLAGESIAGGRWTAAKKARIRESRVEGTRLLASALAACERKPAVFVCASAIGFYGDRGDEVLDEDAAPGEGFLPDVCTAWEAACAPATEAGIRVANLRLGVVLTPAGGALAKMLPPFKLALGGRLGSGRQWMSWVSLDDTVGAIHHALTSDAVSGPVNVVAPHPATNRDFTRTLGRVLRRWTPFPAPAFALRLLFGEMAGPLLLASTRVAPKRLLDTGYAFLQPDLEDTLRRVLGRVEAS